MTEILRKEQKLTMRQGFFIYFCHLVTFLWALFISYFLNRWVPYIWILAVITYFYCGYRLNQKILGRLTWHPIYDTLGNLFHAKIHYFLWWPLSYLVLLFRLMIVRFL